MHRIFCAAPANLESERQAFYRVIGEVNESEGIGLGLLFVPVSLPANTVDKRPAQSVIDSNIRDCRYYVQLLADTWGSPQMNFEHEYRLALECSSSETLPLREVAVLCQTPMSATSAEFQRSLGTEYAGFSTLQEFERELRALLTRWLGSFGPATAST